MIERVIPVLRVVPFGFAILGEISQGLKEGSDEELEGRWGREIGGCDVSSQLNVPWLFI
jgi:hypothetical protein